MKKTISINISGIIFYIEEDGYEKLNNYLVSIQQYFKGYEGNKEIIADIESRIAEIFLAKTDGSKQVITLEDVETLILTMGTTSDFAASEAEEISSQNKQNINSAVDGIENKPVKKLFRDEKRKSLGGVASGIAHYLKIDPLWIRLIFILGTMAYGIFLLAYIILWIAVPGTKGLEDDEQVKKFYRDRDKKVVGGVAAGMAAYFGNDANTLTIIRVAFVISFLMFGAGFYLYLILWIITPEAKTVTEKMQMHGQPVTLSNIEKNIKKNLNAEEDKEESIGIKILLFPFRLISQIFTAIGPLLGSGLKIVIAFIGIIIIIISFSLLFALVMLFLAFIGLIHDSRFHFGHIPTYILSTSVSPVFTIFAFMFALVPLLMLGILGSSILAGKSLITRNVAITFIGIWFVALIGLSISGFSLATQFRRTGKFEETANFNLNNKNNDGHLYLTSNERDEDVQLQHFINFSITGYKGSSLKVEKIYSGQGFDKNDALSNAKMISYNIQQKNDSVILFDEKYTLNQNAKFRAQHLKIRLYIPYGQIFIADENFIDLINSRFRIISDIHFNKNEDFFDHTYNDDLVVGEKYKFVGDGSLECLTCRKDAGINTDDNRNGEEGTDFFNEVKVDGPFEVRIKQSEQNSIEIEAADEIKNKIKKSVKGSTLVIGLEGNFNFNENNFKRPVIYVSMNEFNGLELNGASLGYIADFNDQNNVRIKISGASEAKINLNARETEIELSGNSKLKISGNSEKMNADISGASMLDAFNFNNEIIRAEVSGAGQAKVFAGHELDANVSGSGRIKYRGNPENVKKDESGSGSISKE